MRSMFIFEVYFTYKLDYTSYYTEGTNLDKKILLSNCGKDLSGKKNLMSLKKILEFDAIALFASTNSDHLKLIKNFPNG